MTALRQRAWVILNAMPETEVEKFVNMNVVFEQDEPKTKKGSIEAWHEFEELCGCVSLPDNFDFEAEKDAYMREKYGYIV